MVSCIIVIKLMYNVCRAALRITLDSCEDEGQGINQRVNSPLTDCFLSWKMGGSISSSILWAWGIPRSPIPKFSKTTKKITSNIHLLEIIFSQLSPIPFFWIISFIPKLSPVKSQGQSLIIEGSWRSPDHSILLFNWDTPLLPRTSSPSPECPGQVSDGLCNRAKSLIQGPAWFLMPAVQN